MKKLTTEWLIKEDGCPKGVRWFKRNYPNGMIFTKKNINELVKKLLKKKVIWYNTYYNNTFDVCNNLDWLLHRLGNHNTRQYEFLNQDDWGNYSQRQIVEAFWKDYKSIN